MNIHAAEIADDAVPFVIALEPHGRVMMTRDMELIRRILSAIEAKNDLIPDPVELEDVDEVVLARHMEILFKAELIDGTERKLASKYYAQILVKDLSWEGHEFAAAIKNDSVWTKLKQSMSPAELAGIPFKALKDTAIAYATAWAKQKLGL